MAAYEGALHGRVLIVLTKCQGRNRISLMIDTMNLLNMSLYLYSNNLSIINFFTNALLQLKHLHFSAI